MLIVTVKELYFHVYGERNIASKTVPRLFAYCIKDCAKYVLKFGTISDLDSIGFY